MTRGTVALDRQCIRSSTEMRVDIFTVAQTGMKYLLYFLPLWIIYVFLFCVCYAFVRVCLFKPCGHLLGKG